MVKAIVLLGAPGAGKGTTAEGVKAATEYQHISTGDMLRDAVKKGTALGRDAEGYMKKGELVPDALILRLVEERLDRGGPDAAYLFDGFPRTPEQARLLEASLARRNAAVTHVFCLDAPRDILIARLSGRRICRACGANYHVVNIPPRNEGVCDRCGGELYQRPDDREETIRNRLVVYAKETESLIGYYGKQGTLVRVDSSRPPTDTVAEIVGVLRAAAAR